MADYEIKSPSRALPRDDRGWSNWLRNAKPPEAREWVSMGNGLVAAREPSGKIMFQVRAGRPGERNPRRIALGAFPGMTVTEARAGAAAAKAAAARGEDVRPAREKAIAEAPMLLRELVAKYHERRAGERKPRAPKTLKQERELLAVLCAALGDRPVDRIKPGEIDAAAQDYLNRLLTPPKPKRGKPATRLRRNANGANASKLLAITGRLFRRAKTWGLIVCENPADGLEKPVAEESRERVLFDGDLLQDLRRPVLNELGLLALALVENRPAIPVRADARAALRLCLILGLRAGEAAALETSEVRLDDPVPVLTVTASKTKAGLRTLPLPRQAVELLRPAVAAANGGRFLFPARDGARRSGHLHAESITRAFARLIEVLRIEHVTPHDLRRTCITGLGELGFEGLSGRIAGHAAKNVTAKVYDRGRRLNPMLAALQTWADSIDAAMMRAAAEVSTDANP